MREKISEDINTQGKQIYKLAAIMFTDIVGYTTLMEEDEDRAYSVLEKNRIIHEELIKKYHGKWLKEIGDGTLASFDTVHEAVYCAREIINSSLAVPDLILRIGLHLGEVIDKDGDVLGSEVNIASRIESIAPPGCIWISEPVYRNIANRKEIGTRFIGLKGLKNLKEQVKIYQVSLDDQQPKLSLSSVIQRSRNRIIATVGILVIALLGYLGYQTFFEKTQDDISIAILPFQNLSNDQEVKYLVEGLWRETQTNLSRVKDLRVSDQISVQQYRDNQMPPLQIANLLSVNHMLLGTVQKWGDQLKVNVQLIDPFTNSQIWGDTFERGWSDIHRLQTDISLEIVNQIEANLTDTEIEVMRTAHSSDSLAYDLFLKGSDLLTQSKYREAEEMFEKAVIIDSLYALAWYKLGYIKSRLYYIAVPGYYNLEQTRQAKAAYDKAYELRPELMETRLGQALYYYHCHLDFRRALEMIEAILVDYPQNSTLIKWIAAISRRSGEFERSIEIMKESLRKEPNARGRLGFVAETLPLSRRYKEAEQVIKRMISLDPSDIELYAWLAQIQISIDGNTKRARETLEHPLLKNEAIKNRMGIEILDRNYEKALEYTRFLTPGFYDPHEVLLHQAEIYHLTGSDSSRILYQECIDMINDKIQKIIDEGQTVNEFWYSHLGVAYAAIGEYQKAIEAGLKSVENFNISTDAFWGPQVENFLVDIYIMVGDNRKAVEQLKKLLDHSGYISHAVLKLHPKYDPLREIPEFKALMKDPKYQNNDG